MLMKTSLTLTATVALCATALSSHALASEHSAPSDTLVPAKVIRLAPSAPPLATPRRVVLQLAQATPPTPPHPPGPPSNAQEADAFAELASAMALNSSRAAMSMSGLFGDSKSSKRPVIVAGDSRNNASIEEDLNVMQRILDKSAGGRDEKATAMGIDVLTFAGGSSSNPRSFYLEGYGAMFLLKVKYPLLAPPKGDETRTNDTTNSEWERARQELYGSKTREPRGGWPAPEPFDQERVEKLKTQLIDDLANATHLRAVKSDESITVVVLGGSRGSFVHSENVQRGGRGEGFGFKVETGTPTTMTLRAKKSDVDSFAKGRLKVDEFRKKISVQVY